MQHGQRVLRRQVAARQALGLPGQQLGLAAQELKRVEGRQAQSPVGGVCARKTSAQAC
jgi:hypothetical protein